MAYAQTAMLAAQARIRVEKNRVSRSSVFGSGICSFTSFIGHGWFGLWAAVVAAGDA